MTTDAGLVLPAIALERVLSRRIELPPLLPVRVRSGPATTALDLRAVVPAALAGPLAGVAPGERVAVAVGSRGIPRLGELIALVVEQVRRVGAEPFLVPAMGSHGGATQEGQTEVLAELGIDERIAPVQASMDTVDLGRTQDVQVHVGRVLLEADRVLVVNRIKSHTSFTGRIESGLAKMTAVGLGKQRGAEELHRLGPLQLERRMLAAVDVIRSRLPLLGGLAVLQGRDGTLSAVVHVPAEEIGGDTEAALLERARALEPRLPFDEIDVLVVDRMGKEISGTGMDTNVIGRRMVRGSPEPPGPRITNVVVLGLTAGSKGNAVGLGLADFVPVALLRDVDLATTYANALTSGIQGVQRAQVPIALATERDALAAALLTANVSDPQQARVVRIRSTRELDQLLVSANLASNREDIEIVGSPGQPEDARGRLAKWPRADTDR